MQTVLFGWAEINATLSPVSLLVSISLMMCARMLISNILPFTSPVFAYLVTKSMPPGMAWAATFYLLLGSIPAGLILPALDTVLYHTEGKQAESADPDAGMKYRFLGTARMAQLTDWLPFSFWVRPLFMEPVFKAARRAGKDDATCASAAVLAGHFMIWAGPATTMCQRLFVPDLVTCALIQPLGLMEDVAVVLATWAGESAESARLAEMGMYLFMMLMNLLNFATTTTPPRESDEDAAPSPEDAAEDGRDRKERAVVFGVTAVALLARVLVQAQEVATTTTTTIDPSACETEHSNVGAMILIAAKASAVAIIARLLAVVLVPRLSSSDSDVDSDWVRPLLA